MKARNARNYSRRGSRHGIALVIVLAFVVLLTILVVSFLAFSGLNHISTAGYSKSIQAQEIAQGGMEDILSDLHSEIIAGSINASAYTVNGVTIYVPATNFTAVPARQGYAASSWGTDSGTATLSPTLVRVSRASQDGTPTHFYPPYNTTYYTGTLPINRASPASSGTASSNGRYISASRWNKTYLLATNAAAVPSPFYKNSVSLPTSSYPAIPDLPDWVYVTRTGSRACTPAEVLTGTLSLSSNLTQNYGTITPGSNPPASPIIGRYAYVMYDEGALLDANAAGYVSTATYTATGTYSYTNTAPFNIQMLSGKSYLSYADLTQLPGLTTGTITSLVNWRSAGGIAGGNSSGTGNPYMGAIFNYAQNGFLSAHTGDSPFVNRQDLINYFTSIDPNINTTSATFSKALPYLGTFSREVNAPSYFPPLDAASIPGYKNSASPQPLVPDLNPVPTYHTSMDNPLDASGNPNANPDLANVRFGGTGTLTVTHYNDDASTGTYTVSAGDPLLQTRFSLSRIAWLSQTWAGQPDPGTDNASYASSAYPAAIQGAFGLVWDYPGATSGTMANGGNKCWNYVGSTLSSPGVFSATSSSPASTIETLAQVAAESVPREPNFFELLKAAILNGSIGKSPGVAAFSNGTSVTDYNLFSTPAANTYGPAGLFSYSFDGHWAANKTPTALAPASIPDCQIIQIGANIIDQYDADSFPTAIYFKYSGLGGFDAIATGTTPNGDSMSPIYGPVDMFYGDENLPYIHRVFPVITSTNPAGAADPTDATDLSTLVGGVWTGGTQTLSGWMQPELWNPHQQPATTLFPNGQKFQMRAYGSMFMTWSWDKTGVTTPTNWFTDNANTTANPVATLNFTDSSTTSSFYAHPFLLTSDSIPALGAATVSFPTTGALSNAAINIAQPNYPNYTLNGNLYHFVAFLVGTTPTTAGVSPNIVFYTPAQNIAGKGSNYSVNVLGTGSKPLPCNTYSLGWVDSLNGFHPYSYLAGAFPYMYGTINTNTAAANGTTSENGSVEADSNNPTDFAYIDPRTSRFSMYMNWFSGSTAKANVTTFPTSATRSVGRSSSPNGGRPSNMPSGSGFVPTNTGTLTPADYLVNSATIDVAEGQSNASVPLGYYADPDGVIRPADGFFGNKTTGDGEPLFSSNGAPTGGKYASGDSGGSVSHGRRPVILNRPFRNVGELGYTFRDLPFKTLDFFSTASGDAGLLDVFSVTDEPKVVAGRLALNNAPAPVIQAVLSQGSKKDYDPSYNLGVEPTSVIPALASAIANKLNPTSGGPLLNRAGLVNQLGVNPALTRAQLLTTPPIYSALLSDSLTADAGNKPYFEAPMRALSSVTNTRTWNLMIDVIAQSGHLTSTATSLDNFVVEGEKRYWLHIAIDRYTGKIVDQQLEPVYE